MKVPNLPDIESNVNYFDSSGRFKGFSLDMEKHAMVPWTEAVGLTLMGYQRVNVAQRLDINYIGGRLNFESKTDVFPSASLFLRGSGNTSTFKLMQYDQPSYRETHSWLNGKRNAYLYPR